MSPALDVPEGYKLTEVGVIPGDWELRKLGELATFRTGPFGSALHKSDYTSNGVPIVNPMHIIDGQIVPTQSMTITAQAATTLSEFRLKPGEVVIGRRGDMGRCAVVRSGHLGWLCGTGSMIVRPSVGLDADFLQRVLSSPSVVSAIEETSVGSTMINLNQATLSGLAIQAPQPPEQRAIATALSDVDALLAKLDQLIAKKRDLNQAAMQQLLTGQTRLPGFSGEWEVKRLGNICTMKSGESITSANIDEHSKFPCYGGNGLRGFASRYTHDGNYALIGRQGALCGNVLNVDGQFFASEHAIVVTSLNQTDIRWLTIVLRKMNLNQYSESSAQPGLSVVKLLLLTANVPPTDEQTAIATLLSDMDAELAALEARRDKTRALKQGMMQALLTGRIRLV